jgi:NAD-dependent deacetylase
MLLFLSKSFWGERSMMNEELEKRIQTLAQWLYESKYPVIFTGAGISTDSGIPDFRGPDGLWTRKDKGLPAKPMKPWDSVDPNINHKAVVELQDMGKMKFLISQNIDNLHLKSGIRPDLLAELHGNIALFRCRRCEKTIAKSTEQKNCTCGGELKSSVVDFGQSLPRKDLALSLEHSGKCDLFIVVGSSLVVTPAAHMPQEALDAGAKLIIINQGETPFDRAAHLRFSEAISEVFPLTIKRLKKLMGLFE